MNKKTLSALILLTFARYCYAPAFTIDTPGYYELGEDITFSPGVADAIIVIQASDVELNLGRRIIEQGNATADVDGIQILGSNISNVIIRNGTIRNVTGFGINIAPGGTNNSYTIDGVTFINCQERGLSINTVNNFLIQNCTFTQCAQASTGDAVLFLTNSSFGTIRNSRITTSTFTATGTALFGIRSSNSSFCTFSNLVINQLSANTTLALHAMSFDGGATNSIVSNVAINQTTNPGTGGANGITIDSASGNLIFTDCRASTIASTAGTATFFNASSGTTPVVIMGCAALAIAGATSHAFNFTSVTNYSIIDCLAQGCSSTGAGLCHPFRLNTCTRCNCIRCYSFTNTSANGTCIGMSLVSCNSCSISQCIGAGAVSTGSTASGFLASLSTSCTFDSNGAYRNSGTTSQGLSQAVSTSCAFIKNTALRNGTTAAAQFNGFAAGQANTQVIASVNSITEPWTNAGLV